LFAHPLRALTVCTVYTVDSTVLTVGSQASFNSVHGVTRKSTGNALFGARLRELRMKRGLTQIVLGELAGMSQGKVSDLEVGRGTPYLTPDEMTGLAAALEVHPGELLGVPLPDIHRLNPIAQVTDALTDSDIEALTITARQLASARAAALPARDDIPGWAQMTPQEQRAYEEAEALVRRMSRLRVAEPSATYGAGAKRGSGGRAGGGRSPGGAARAQV